MSSKNEILNSLRDKSQLPEYTRDCNVKYITQHKFLYLPCMVYIHVIYTLQNTPNMSSLTNNLFLWDEWTT